MKNNVITIIALLLVILIVLSACGGKKEETNNKPQPLNISVFLDLSDRLTRVQTPDQTYRDTAIINYIADYFKNKTLGPTILKSENKMKVFFYPTPDITEISTLAQGLSVDIGSKHGVGKRQALEDMKGIFQKNLEQIYNATLKEKKWIGCDIWGFFTNKKVDDLCVKNGARNIVVILTDGYIFADNNKRQEGENAFAFISPRTLANPNSMLIDRRQGELKGKGLEVLMLEVNPYQPKQRDKMVQVLKDWFTSMGVERFVVAETDANLTNTETIITNFLDNPNP